MNVFLIKVIAVGGLVFLLVSTPNNRCMSLPKDELVVYQSMIKSMPDKELVHKYQQEFGQLQKNFTETAKKLNLGPDGVSQLPIFKVAVFKAIINEIKQRQEKTHTNLITSEQVRSADKLINEKEKQFKTGLEQERRK